MTHALWVCIQVDADKFTIEKEAELVVLPEDVRVPLPCIDLPELVLQSINAITAHDSASYVQSVEGAGFSSS